LGRAKQKGFYGSLTGDTKEPTISEVEYETELTEDGTKAIDKKALFQYKSQMAAQNHYLTYCAGSALTSIEGLPTAQAMKEKLEMLFAPTDMVSSYQQLEMSYNECKCEKGQDPVHFIMELRKHSERLGKVDKKYAKDEYMMKVHITG
jgi:hypothetical protein